jgi:hypothetical protein
MFDGGLFRISPAEAPLMDPQLCADFRILLWTWPCSMGVCSGYLRPRPPSWTPNFVQVFESSCGRGHVRWGSVPDISGRGPPHGPPTAHAAADCARRPPELCLTVWGRTSACCRTPKRPRKAPYGRSDVSFANRTRWDFRRSQKGGWKLPTPTCRNDGFCGAYIFVTKSDQKSGQKVTKSVTQQILGFRF